MEKKERKRILSGIQPTGTFTLGNYLGAVKNWPSLQKEYHCAYFIANLHAITVHQQPQALFKKTVEAYALLLACGINPKESLVFIQSQVPTHAEAGWVLQCNAGFGELSRMTQFKDKSQKLGDAKVSAGLFGYPALMAGDILLYQADLVPVGADQKQHLEITRDMAQRFNRLFGDTFTLPEPFIPKEGAKIMSLQEPTKKMSKSDENPKATITILEDPDQIIKKFKGAVTDSEASVHYGEGKDGINNLMTIYSCFTGESHQDIEKSFSGKGYGFFKEAVGEVVADHLRPIRKEYETLMSDPDALRQLYTKGAEEALAISSKTLQSMYDHMGLLR